MYEAAGGSEGLLRLAEAWHSRVMADEIVSHAFSHGFHPQHSERLAAYWAEALGGPATYSGSYGDETSVVRIHSGNGPHEEMDRRAIACFDQALHDAGLDAAEPLRQVLHDYFAWATTTTMSRYHDSADDVPEGMTHPAMVLGRTSALRPPARPAPQPPRSCGQPGRIQRAALRRPWRRNVTNRGPTVHQADRHHAQPA